jgi:hypothetical protein
MRVTHRTRVLNEEKLDGTDVRLATSFEEIVAVLLVTSQQIGVPELSAPIAQKHLRLESHERNEFRET